MDILRHVDRIRMSNLYFKDHRMLFLNYDQCISVMNIFWFANSVEPREPDLLAQLVTHPTADQGVTSLVPARSNILVEIDHEIISTVILLLPLIPGGLSVISESKGTKYWLTA